MAGTTIQHESSSTTSSDAQVSDMTVVPVRHYGRWAVAAASLLTLGLLVASMISNPNYRWDVVFTYFFSPRILEGLRNTLVLTVVAMLIGVALGVIIALLRQSPNPVLSKLAGLYIWFFRGTPLFVQLLFWGYIAALYPSVSLGIPFTEIQFYSADTNTLMTPWLAAVLGLSLNESAYMAEIVRGGINSIDPGQREAGQAIGMSKAQIMKRIMLPQAMRVILPPTGNNVISMLKTTSVVSVLAFPELLYSAQLIYAVNYLTIPLLIVASIWYLIVTTILSVGQHYLEQHFEQGHRNSSSRPTLLQKLSRSSERNKRLV
ncbi:MULTISPECIES: amino acid ABC transporter permease [unclassified Arthrobacter]|uniref:amino acid ABC transporter permease n=1 Tax=unclassified Arthrobacter TaxID=235627 RepID=UPI001C6159F2|nr:MULTISPECIES: amino acid ABC transporter permease [unclassified Arthrobacter]